MAVDVVVVEEGAVGMPQLDPAIYPNLVFWLVLSLVALYLILTRVAVPRIGNVLLERNEAISNDLEQAATFKRRAEEAEASYNAALARAREQSNKIAAETKAQINKELATLMAKADAEIAAKSAESSARIAEVQESALQSISEVARETAPAIVAALMPEAADRGALDAAIDARLRS